MERLGGFFKVHIKGKSPVPQIVTLIIFQEDLEIPYYVYYNSSILIKLRELVLQMFMLIELSSKSKKLVYSSDTLTPTSPPHLPSSLWTRRKVCMLAADLKYELDQSLTQPPIKNWNFSHSILNTWTSTLAWMSPITRSSLLQLSASSTCEEPLHTEDKLGTQ